MIARFDQHPTQVQQLSTNDVALLKGEVGLQCRGGLVHRSPQLQQEEQRLLLTLDFINTD